MVNIVLRNRKNTIVVPNMPNVDPTTVKQKKINPIVPASCQRRRVVRKKKSCQEEELSGRRNCQKEELPGRRVARKKSCPEEELTGRRVARKKKVPERRNCQEQEVVRKLTGRS